MKKLLFTIAVFALPAFLFAAPAAPAGFDNFKEKLAELQETINLNIPKSLARPQGGFTELCSAVHQGRIEDIKHYLHQINITCDGYSPLMIAATWNKQEILDLLIANGADVNIKNPSGYNALILAVDSGRENEELVRSLLKVKGIKLDEKYFQGFSALHIAARRGYLDITQQLLEAGANVDIRDNDGRTPLMTAVIHLKNFGKDFERNFDWNTIRMLIWFVKYDGNINAVDNEGRTALIHAVRKGGQDSCDIIMLFKAECSKTVSTYISDNDGMNAWDYARQWDASWRNTSGGLEDCLRNLR